MIVKCKTCGEEIEFVHNPEVGISKTMNGEKNKKKEKIVYLTCENSHTHPYKLEF